MPTLADTLTHDELTDYIYHLIRHDRLIVRSIFVMSKMLTDDVTDSALMLKRERVKAGRCKS